MIIINRWFTFQAPRRPDLSGRPLGFLFVWRSRLPSQLYASLPHEFGIHLPSLRKSKFEEGECIQLSEKNEWKAVHIASEDGAIKRFMQGFPAGSAIIADKIFIDRRTDLASFPYQRLRRIAVKKGAPENLRVAA